MYVKALRFLALVALGCAAISLASSAHNVRAREALRWYVPLK